MTKDAPYYAFATIPVKPEYYEDAKQAILDITPLTLAEEGCEVFILHGSYDEEKSELYLYEVFRDEEAFNFHHEQEYTKAVFEKYKTWLNGDIEIKRLKSVF